MSAVWRNEAAMSGRGAGCRDREAQRSGPNGSGPRKMG